MFIKDSNGRFNYSWSFDKKEYYKNYFKFDLNINFKSSNEKKIDSLIKSKIKKEYVSFDYHGKLPSSATIKIPVSNKFNEGDELKLYYYDDKEDQIELVDSNVKVINGYVSFEIDHCSDYFLTLSIVKEASNKNNNGMIIIAMLIIIVALVGYTMFKNKK